MVNEIYILDLENFDCEKYIYVRHFETCYVIIRTQIHHMLYIYAKVVMRSLTQKHMDIWWMCFRLNGASRLCTSKSNGKGQGPVV